jgi:hypothetical protein
MNYDEWKEIKLALVEPGEHFKRLNERLDTLDKVFYTNPFFVSLHFIRLDISFMFFFLMEKRFDEQLLVNNQVHVRSFLNFIFRAISKTKIY